MCWAYLILEMPRRVTVLLVLVCASAVMGGWRAGVWAAPSDDHLPAQVREGLQRFCIECHGDKKAKKDLRLNQFVTIESVLRERRVWNRVLAHVMDGQMPPEEADLVPDKEEREALAFSIKGVLNEVDWERYRRPGREVSARLTRQQYKNTMSDLLGIDLHPEEDFVADGEGESGFHNERASLTAGGAQVEKYFEAAERAVEGVMALVFPSAPIKEQVAAELMERSMPGKMQSHRGGMSLANPGQELTREVDFPADGYYQISLRASVMGKPTTALLRIDGRVAAEIPVSGAETDKRVWPGVVFSRKGRHLLSIENKNMFPQRRVLPPNAASLTVQEGKHNHPRLAAFAKEDKTLKFERQAYNQRSAGVQEAYEWLRLLGVEGDSREIDRFRNYAWQREKGLTKARHKLASLAAMKEGDIDTVWKKQNQARLADNKQLLDRVKGVQWADWMGYQGKIFLSSMEIKGPVYVDKNHHIPEKGGISAAASTLLGLLKNWDQGDAGSLELLEQFLPLAFRRNLDEGEYERYAELYASLKSKTTSSAKAMSLSLTAILTSPEFLFRDEHSVATGEDGIERLDDWAMASRVSYFLWSTMPDEKLFRLAGAGELKKEVVLRQEVDRLLDDERSKVFFRSFAGQWLGIDSLGKTVVPDAREFPEFTPDLAELMKEETMRYFESVFTENRPLTELLDSNWSFLNGRLAQHYGIDGVRGATLHKVDFDDRRRGGLLGMGSVLTVTSSPARTNPMRRGFWVLEGLLGDYLGEPPGDAGELPGDAGGKRGKTLREEIELHRTQKSCMSCHVKLDPIGFGLQNFDALGRWRDEEAGKPVDSSGVMPDGRKFNGPVELKQVLLEHKDEFVKNLCARMLGYALGRKLEYFDEAEVQRIFDLVKKDNYHARTLIREVVVSYPFRYRDAGD